MKTFDDKQWGVFQDMMEAMAALIVTQVNPENLQGPASEATFRGAMQIVEHLDGGPVLRLTLSDMGGGLPGDPSEDAPTDLPQDNTPEA